MIHKTNLYTAQAIAGALIHQFEKSLSHNTVTAVEMRGKAVLTRFDNGLTIYNDKHLIPAWLDTYTPGPIQA